MRGTRYAASVFAISILGACAPETPQDSMNVTATLADYLRAEQRLAPNTTPLVEGVIQSQSWQQTNSAQLIYRRVGAAGSEYVLADAVTGEKRPLLDSARLATVLANFVDAAPALDELALTAVQLDSSGRQLEFRYSGKTYTLDLDSYDLQQHAASPPDEYLSPDRSKAAFIDSYNLWVRDTATNAVTQVTFDGVENYGYATNNAGWIRDNGPVLLWSPDSSKIATFRHDGRNVGEMYLYNTQVGHVELDAWKYPLPGDESIFMIERVVIDLSGTPKLVSLQMPPDPHRSTTSDHVAGAGGIFLDVEWSADSKSLAFVSSSRDHKIAELRLADPDTGAVRDIYREEQATYYEGGFSNANWRVLPGRDEFIWFSERDNWGHLYLHDLATGALKHPITSGNWSVLDVQHLDLANDWIYFLGANREPGDPYFQYLYRVHFDGSGLENLTPEPANHEITWSPSHDFFTDIYSTPTTAPTAVIRSVDGNAVLALESSSLDRLLATGWVAPEPFTVKARDQQTDLYGLLYKPSNFDPALRYPVLNYLYPGPQTGSVGTRSFRAARNDKQALAELGFIVV